MIRLVDTLLNRITMYRLVLYELIFLLLGAAMLGYIGYLPYQPQYLLFSSAFLVTISWLVNKGFAFFFETATNPESTYISALILALIITPPVAWVDPTYLSLAFWAAALAMASKYILAIRGKHLFNPAALGVAVTALALDQSASWWVGTLSMVPLVCIGGLLVVRKIRRFDLFMAYLIGLAATISYFEFAKGFGLVNTIVHALFYTPAFFFATAMLTEPLTTPPTKSLRMFYGALVGCLFAPEVHFGSLYLTPELALLIGNIFSYLVSPKEKLLLYLKDRIRITHDVYEFAFATMRPMSYTPGQYMEWTLPHSFPDSRGSRRYFTLASSPTEEDLKLSVKLSNPPSSFKKKLLSMQEGDVITASQRSGGFILPSDSKKKLVCIAGGIGITPFRSMVQYLLDRHERRDMVLLYSNKSPEDVAYRDIFDRASREVGLRTIYAFTGIPAAEIPAGAIASIDRRAIAENIPDWRKRTFYISGPQGMVTAFRKMLLHMGVKRYHIKTDYFPGF